MECDKKFLIEADTFNKAMQANIPKRLRNLCTYFNMLMPTATDFASAKSLTMCRHK